MAAATATMSLDRELSRSTCSASDGNPAGLSFKLSRRLQVGLRSLAVPTTLKANPQSRVHLSASSAAPVLSVEDEAPSQSPDIASIKLDLLTLVAGLDRGLSASETDVAKVNTVAGLLEDAGGPVRLGEGEGLQGRWRLIYSSAFASGSLGGRRPGPPVGRLPLTLGQVYQRIDVLARELDNLVELRVGTPWPLPPLEVTATLAHTFTILGDNDVKITFEKTFAKLGVGLLQLPLLEFPQLPDFLRPSSSLRSGNFDCTYLDDNMRVTRGDRGELRVFTIA